MSNTAALSPLGTAWHGNESAQGRLLGTSGQGVPFPRAALLLFQSEQHAYQGQQKKGFLSEIAKVLFYATHPFFYWFV